MVDLYKVKDECMRELNRIGIYPKCIRQVTWNQRKTSWGVCKNVWPGMYDIQLSYSLKESYDGAVETMYHELLHACGPDYAGHTGKWLTAANLVNEKLGTNIKRCSTVEDKHVSKIELTEQYNYGIYCPTCKKYIAYRRNLSGPAKNPERYRCSNCGCEHLEVVDL